MPILKKRLKTEALSLFFRQMAAMLGSGLGVTAALETLSDGNEDGDVKGIATDVAQNLSSETGMTQTGYPYPEWFHTLITFLMKKSPSAKDASSIMYSIADEHENMEDLERRFISVLVYPVTTIIVAICVTAVILVFVIPTFQHLFGTMSEILPTPTRLVINISSFFSHFAILIFLAIAGFIGTVYYKKNVRDKILLAIPGINQNVKTFSAIKFSRYLSIMLSLDAPVNVALETAASAVTNTIHSRLFRDTTADVSSSAAIPEALSKTGLFPKMAIRILTAGEKSGSIDMSLKELSKFYEKNVMFSIEKSIRIFEIMTTVIIAAIIGTLVISMYLPIFKLGSVVGG